MAIATFRGEKNVGEIANKLFSRLTLKQREKAELAILKANPQLRNIRKLKKGSVLRIPDMPELRAKTNRTLENPDDQMAENVAEALGVFSKRLEGRLKDNQQTIKDQTSFLKSAKFKKEIAKAQELQPLVASARKALSARSKTITERETLLNKSLREALSDLKGGLK